MKKLLAFALLFCSPLHAVVILVHGTHAVDESWARPGGKFYEELRGQAGERKLSLLVPFAWSGHLSGEARVQAAEALCDLIESYPWDEEIILIGHSHGGNVINLASQMLENPEGVELSLGQKILDKLFRSLPSETRKVVFAEPRKIKEAYYLGTPVMDKPYLPNMNVIERLYNCYSKGDSVQTGMGVLYGRTIKGHERITNLCLKISGRKPSHSDMHHYKIAKWLFTIPADMGNSYIYLEKDGSVSYEAQ